LLREDGSIDVCGVFVVVVVVVDCSWWYLGYRA
jgi:hypothetical protein